MCAQVRIVFTVVCFDSFDSIRIDLIHTIHTLVDGNSCTPFLHNNNDGDKKRIQLHYSTYLTNSIRVGGNNCITDLHNNIDGILSLFRINSYVYSTLSLLDRILR